MEGDIIIILLKLRRASHPFIFFFEFFELYLLIFLIQVT